MAGAAKDALWPGRSGEAGQPERNPGKGDQQRGGFLKRSGKTLL